MVKQRSYWIYKEGENETKVKLAVPIYSDIKMLVGDFNAKVGREGIFGPTVGKHSLHEKPSDNGFRLVSFAAAQNMVISSTRFQHLNIHNAA